MAKFLVGPELGPERHAIIDVANVAHCGEARPRLRCFNLVRDHVIGLGWRCTSVADAALRHRIDEQREFERLIRSNAILQAPKGTPADTMILELARRHNGWVISNDRFTEWASAFPEEVSRVMRFDIVHGRVKLAQW